MAARPGPARQSRSTRTGGRRRVPPGAGDAFERLVAIMAILRSPGGCPWDIAQTHETLRPFLIEETYEAVEALDRGDFKALPGELGDVLLQCVFHAELGAEARRFTIVDVVNAITHKLISRHPHVFRPDGRPLPAGARARSGVTTPGAVKERWAAIKATEQKQAGERPRLLTGLPRALPALVRAQKIGTRVASVGFDWTTPEAVLAKVDEELDEFRRALPEGIDRATEELGDVLFTIANLARKLSIDPERALALANDKFTRRFNALETHLEADGRDVHEASQAELEAAWQAIKRAAAPAPPRRATGGRSRPSRSPRRTQSRS